MTRETDRLWSRNTLGVTPLVCWTALMEGQRYSEFSYYYKQCSHRFVLKGVNYNPLDVMNVLMLRRGYKVEGDPQQRTLPSIHHKDDKYDDSNYLHSSFYIVATSWRTRITCAPRAHAWPRSWPRVWSGRTATWATIIKSRSSCQKTEIDKLQLLDLQLSITCQKMFLETERTRRVLVRFNV